MKKTAATTRIIKSANNMMKLLCL